MSSRRHIPPAHEGRFIQAPVMVRHVPPEILENKLAVQTAELEQLAGDNHRLAATHVALRRDVAAAEEEIQKLKEHIRSIQTESDIQIRVLFDRITKSEADSRAGENVNQDLQQAIAEARGLVATNQELAAQIKQSTDELEKARDDVKKLPEMHDELESLRQEHQRLRSTFEQEKGFNIAKVQQMQMMEKDLVNMAKEVERLRAEVLNAERTTHAFDPYGRLYMNSDSSYPLSIHGSAGYAESYGRTHLVVGSVGEGMVPYGSSSMAAAPNRNSISSAVGNTAWEDTYDSSLTQR